MNIQNMLPQRPPIVMVDGVSLIDDLKAETSFKILPDNIFVKDGKFMECGIVEHMAQSVAAMQGMRGTEVRVGVIGELRKIRFNTLPSVNDEIRSCVELEMEFGNTLSVSVETFCGDTNIATGRIKVFLM